MAGSLAQPVVLDTTVLSNFASSGSIDWLIELLERPAATPAVRDELERGRSHGHTFLDTAIDPLGDKLSLLDVDGEDEGVLEENSAIRDELDPGEAESLLVAIRHGGTLATDDLAARRLASDHGVGVTGSVGLLVLGIEQDALDVTIADQWLETWRTKRGYYAPVESIEDIIDN